MGHSVFVHWFLVPASAVCQHPLPVIVDGQTGFDEHLDGSVEGNDDQHPFSVSEGTGS